MLFINKLLFNFIKDSPSLKIISGYYIILCYIINDFHSIRILLLIWHAEIDQFRGVFWTSHNLQKIPQFAINNFLYIFF